MATHKIIIAGCGSMSHTWLEYALQRENAVIAGLVDLHVETALTLAEKFDLEVPVFTDINEAIKNTGANLVFDVTIPAAHPFIVSAALKAGCHVFGEKPMAETVEDAQRLVDCAMETGKSYSVMQNRRYNRQIRAFGELLASGMIGDIGSLHANFFLGPHFGGFREIMDSPLIVDMAIHTFDQARFLLQADPVSVYCHEYNPKGSWYKGNASAVCIFEMNDGSVFTYNGSWCAEGLNTSWESDWRATGSSGSAAWDGTTSLYAEIKNTSNEDSFIYPVERKNYEGSWTAREGHWGCLDEMFASIENGRNAETDCRDNIKSMKMVFGAVESAKKGVKIHF